MNDFNLSRKTIPRLISVILFIIALSVIRINFGYSLVAILLIIPVEKYLFKNQTNTEKVVYSIKGKTFVIIGCIFIAVLIIGAPFYGPWFQDFLIHTFKINPDTALDSIRSFFGIHIQP